jgi:hypothetical protein
MPGNDSIGPGTGVSNFGSGGLGLDSPEYSSKNRGFLLQFAEPWFPRYA